MTTMRVAITGGTGMIGTALTDSLTRDGHRVHRLTRKPRRAGDFAFDPARRVIDPAAFHGVDVVVHLAGELIGQRWNDTVRRRIRESRTEGTRLVAATLAGLARKPRVLVSASAIGIYGDRADEVLTEASVPGNGYLAEVCVAWEAAAAPARAAGIRVAHARTGVVLSRAGGALARLLSPFRLGVGGRIGSGTQWMSWISLADEVAGLRLLIEDGTLEGPVNLTSPSPVTNAEFTKTLAHVLHRPALIRMPAFALRLVFNEMADATLIASQRVLPRRLLGAGLDFSHPTLERALGAVLD